MRPNYAAQIRALPDDALEEFVEDWLAQRKKEYHSHELWRGTGDMGRDVTGYVTDRRLEGPWDNFQCKQLSRALSMPSVLVEMGKIFMHSANGEFSLPRAYVFVAPRGVQRAVQSSLAHPEQMRQTFVSQWDDSISAKLIEKQVVSLTPAIKTKIEAFDFKQVSWFDANRLVNDRACMPALVKWFGEDPGRAPRGVVPHEVEGQESAYVGQLLRCYNAKGPASYPTAAAALASADHGTHLRDQRTRFFDAVEFDRFYRDSTPDDYLLAFKDEIYHGVAETHRESHPDGLTRVSQVMKHASILQPSGILGKHASPQVKQGTCHQFANEGRLPWHK